MADSIVPDHVLTISAPARSVIAMTNAKTFPKKIRSKMSARIVTYDDFVLVRHNTRTQYDSKLYYSNCTELGSRKRKTQATSMVILSIRLSEVAERESRRLDGPLKDYRCGLVSSTRKL